MWLRCRSLTTQPGAGWGGAAPFRLLAGGADRGRDQPGQRLAAASQAPGPGADDPLAAAAPGGLPKFELNSGLSGEPELRLGNPPGVPHLARGDRVSGGRGNAAGPAQGDQVGRQSRATGGTGLETRILKLVALAGFSHGGRICNEGRMAWQRSTKNLHRPIGFATLRSKRWTRFGGGKDLTFEKQRAFFFDPGLVWGGTWSEP
jgi:hypothetical protein